MKTLKTLATCAFLAIAATAWAETLGNLQPLVQLSSIRREFAGTAQAGKLLKVQGLSSTQWTAKSNVSWIKLTKSSGKGGESVAYSVEENDGDAREGEITVISNGESSTFTVRQGGHTFWISPETQKYSAGQHLGKQLRVTSARGWKAKSNRQWIIITSGATGKASGDVIYTVLQNTTGKVRKGKITVRQGSKRKTHLITQTKKGRNDSSGTLELTSTQRVFSCEAAANKELSLRANVPWEVDTTAGWIDIVTLEGKGNGSIVYGIEENEEETERTGKILVTGGGDTKTFTVKQQGRPAPKLTLEESSASLGATGTGVSGMTVSVDANVKWTATSQDSWIKVTGGASGNGDGTVEYYVGLTMDAGTRSGSITVEGGGLARSFTVHQKGPDPILLLGASSRTFAASGGASKELKVSGNVSWTAKSSASWLKVKKGSGKGGGTIVYDVAANTGAARTAAITVSGGGLTRTFTVKQDGKSSGGGGDPAASLILGASERTFTADAASGKELKVTANVSWTAKSSASWLVVKTASGSGNGKIVYNVAANTSASSRTATITVSGGGLTRTFTVKQDGQGSGPKSLHRRPASRVWVTASDGTDASAVIDHDESTAWSPTTPAPSWLALSFETPRPVEKVEVLGENLPAGMRALLSPDAHTWTEEEAASVSYLWLILPGEGTIPVLREVSTLP